MNQHHHPYPALPKVESRPPVTWQDLLDRGCPRCGCDEFQEWSLCYGLHDIEIELDFDPELDEDVVLGVVAHWDTHTNLIDKGEIRCQSCGYAPTIIDERKRYAYA